MNKTPGAPADESVLIFTPLPEDETALSRLVAVEGEQPKPVNEDTLKAALGDGAGCLIMTEETLGPETVDMLLRWAKGQPAWSALPVLILTRDTGKAPSPLRGAFSSAAAQTVQVMLLHRPSTPEVLRGSLRNAMASRRRQYLIRDQMKELESGRKQIELLGREVQHRAKNNLARVSAIIRQTWRSAKDSAQFIESVESRIAAAARGLDLMTEGDWEGAALADLFIVEARAIFGKQVEDRLRWSGETIRLNYDAALALHLVAHELATNALKYGAFSNREGFVNLRWRRLAEESQAETIELVWEEQAGPDVTQPEISGFGSQIIEQSIKAQLRGEISVQYAPGGLTCRMVLPLAAISRDRR
ncbi:sensor histidine kinase [Hyphococcus sp.]|uniref:sensor histidine kinase n=1 Tax=Hyphococcus sp. TaxID=2038636 RepID=UPI003CCB9656